MEIKSKFKSSYSLLNDSTANAKDMTRIYQSIGYSYDPIPPENASRADLNKPKAPESKPKIVNGQLAVESGTGNKFMNTKVKPELLAYLHKKYNSTIFVFINELDIKNDPESYDANTDSYQREITVHYSIMDVTGNFISYGISKAGFSSKVNDPDKIIKNDFSAASKIICDKLVKTLTPPETLKEEKKNTPRQKTSSR